MRVLMLAGLVAVLGLTSGCVTKEKTTYSTPSTSTAKPNNEADCERAGGKWKSVTHHCDMDD